MKEHNCPDCTHLIKVYTTGQVIAVGDVIAKDVYPIVVISSLKGTKLNPNHVWGYYPTDNRHYHFDPCEDGVSLLCKPTDIETDPLASKIAR